MTRGHHNNLRLSTIQEARLQLFLDFAEDTYLNRLAANLGVTERPLGHTDDLFRALIKKTALTRHSVLKVFVDVLDILIGPRKTRVFEFLEDANAGDYILKLVDVFNLPQVGRLRIDPEVVRDVDNSISGEEIVDYCYVDYRRNEVWLTEPLLYPHKSRFPGSSLSQDIIIGDSEFTVADGSTLPIGSFLGVLNKGESNEELFYILKRNGNILTRLGSFNTKYKTKLSITGDLKDVAHEAGELFRFDSLIDPPAKLVNSISKGSFQFQVEAFDSIYDISNMFPTKEFTVTLSPGTPYEEDIYIYSNDRLDPSTFSARGASAVPTSYTFPTYFEVSNPSDFTNHFSSDTSPFHVIVNRDVNGDIDTAVDLVVQWDGISGFNIIEGAAPSVLELVELPLSIIHDHAAGSAVLLKSPREAALTEPIKIYSVAEPCTWNGTTTITVDDATQLSAGFAIRLDSDGQWFEVASVTPGSPDIITILNPEGLTIPIGIGKTSYLTSMITYLNVSRVGIFDDSLDIDAFSAILNQGESNEDIVSIDTLTSNKTSDVMGLSDLSDIKHTHQIGDSVRPSTIVMDGVNWEIREDHHKVIIRIPKQALPKMRLQDATFLHGNHVSGYLASNDINSGDLSIEFDVSYLDQLKELPEVGLLKITDAIPQNDEYSFYISKNTTELIRSTNYIGRITSAIDNDFYMQIPDFKITDLPPSPFMVEINGTFIEVKEVLIPSIGDQFPSNIKFLTDIAMGSYNGFPVYLCAFQVANPTIFIENDEIICWSGAVYTRHLIDSITSNWLYLDTTVGSPLTGQPYAIVSGEPSAYIPGDGVSLYPYKFKISNESRFESDTGIRSRTGALLSVNWPSYVSLYNKNGEVATTAYIQANSNRLNTSFVVDSNILSLVGYDLLIDGEVGGIPTTTSFEYTDINAPAIPEGYIIKFTSGAHNGELRVQKTGATPGMAEWVTFLSPAPSAGDTFIAFKVPGPFAVIISPTNSDEELHSISIAPVDDTAVEFTATLNNSYLIYPHLINTSVELAGCAKGVASSTFYKIGVDDPIINIGFEGSHVFDDRRYEPQTSSTTTLVTKIAGDTDIVVSAVANQNYFIVREGYTALPASPDRFDVILSAGTLNEETVTVTKQGGNPLTPPMEDAFPDAARLNLVDGKKLQYDHLVFDQVKFPYTELILADSSAFPSNTGRIIINFSYSTEEIVRYASNDGSTTLTLQLPTTFRNTHLNGEKIDLAINRAIPDTTGFDYPAYLEPDPYAKLKFWLNLVKAAGVALEFTN